MEMQENIVIDLNANKNGMLNESWLYMFGGWIETILGRMFGMNSIPVTIKGTKSQVESFAQTLQSEKKYIENYRKYGLDNAQTYKSKSQLENSVKKFESATGLKWPFK